jgi:diguanylate cyclase (GGDEF)-like protein
VSEANNPPFPGAFLDELPPAMPYNPDLPYQPAMQFEAIAALHGTIVHLMNEAARRDTEKEGYLIKLANLYEDRMQEKEAREQAEEAARYDPKLNLLNYPAFQQRVEQRIAHMDRETDKRPSDVSNYAMVIDIDHFKRLINDPLGHGAGDLVLINAAAKLRGSVREDDDVGRLGGEEFVACVYAVTLDEAIRIAERYQEQLRSQTVREMVGDQIITDASSKKGILDRNVTVSIGIAELPQVVGNFDDAFIKADSAMYRVKHASRDGIAYNQNGFTHLVGQDTTEAELLLPE